MVGFFNVTTKMRCVEMKKRDEKSVISDSGVDEIGEFELISKLISKTRNRRFSSIVLGVGDDTAVLQVSSGKLLLATCDSQIQGVHFRRDFSSPYQIGMRAAAVNISDIASMGGEPRFALVSLAVPTDVHSEMLADIYKGMDAVFSPVGTAIVGGNTSSTSGPLVIDITLLGEIEPSRVLTRRGAKSGDVLCVSGELGGSRAGLICLMKDEIQVDEPLRQKGLSAYRTPTPRLAVGKILGECGLISACLDVSDGLAGDALRLAEQSHVAITVDLGKVPVADVAAAVAEQLKEHPAQFAARGGEDFELLFTMPKRHFSEIRQRLITETGVTITAIGDVTDGKGVHFKENKKLLSINMSGFDHFNRRKN